jgi:cell division topological specificity factor
MLDRLKKLLCEQPITGSKDIAKERLRLVLLHDRANVSPQYMGLLRDDMIKVVSNYMDINEQDMEVNLNRDEQTVTLVANIPISAVKRPPVLHQIDPVNDEQAASQSVSCMKTREGIIENAEPTTAAKS